MNRQPYLLPALLLLTLARFLALNQIPLSDIEQHALKGAHHFDFWHQSIGAIIPLLIKISTSLLGENAYGIRFFAPLLILGASWLIWSIGRGLFDNTTAAWSVVFLNVIPAVNLASITLTPTTLAITSSLVVLCSLRAALHQQHPWHQAWWLLGLAMVVAVMVDWRLSCLAVATFLTLLISSRGRRALLRWPVLPILIGCLGFAITMFIAWNSEHDWLAFQSIPLDDSHTLWRSLLQIPLLFSPFILPAMVWAGWRITTNQLITPSAAFLGAFAVFLLIVDIFVWTWTPFPRAATCTWLPAACMLLANQTLHTDSLRPKLLMFARISLLLTAAITSCLLIMPPVLRRFGFI